MVQDLEVAPTADDGYRCVALKAGGELESVTIGVTWSQWLYRGPQPITLAGACP